MTLLENVSCPLRIMKKVSQVEAERRAINLLEEWGLGRELQNQPAQLSGGQRQRGALARAWLMEPKILALDEVTSGLDPENTAAILKSILALKKTETILLMITHQLNFARAIADQVIFMAEGGRIIEKGTAKEVLEQHKDPQVARFVAAFAFTGSQQCE
jgi:ABC-type polar amino acid transport system ATPase subunit